MRKSVLVLMLSGMLLSQSVFAQDSMDDSMGGEVSVSSAQSGVERVESVIAKGQEMLVQANAEEDVARIDCLNALLVAAKGFLNVAQNSCTNLQDASVRNDSASMQHHYKLIQLSVSKASGIEARMNECSSGMLGSISGTKAETIRRCKVEPCLDGKEFIDPESPTKALTIGNGAYGLVDASPYL